jgi:hypothetical protein
VDDVLLDAVNNNASWCDLVCRSVGVPTEASGSLWVALRRSPPLYPDAITLSPTVTADDVVHAVVAGEGCSVKDGFATLDLDEHGFQVLFDARWFYRPPALATPSGPGAWTVLDSAAARADWSLAAGDAVAIPGDALNDPAVRVLAATGPRGIAAGAVAFRTASVVGISNVFGDTADPATWAGIADAVAGAFPSLPLVGYETGEPLRAALESGFEDVGALRVWLQPAPATR